MTFPFAPETHRLTYASGEPIREGDIVRRSAQARTLWRVELVTNHPPYPLVCLTACASYASVSLFSAAAIARLRLVEAAHGPEIPTAASVLDYIDLQLATDNSRIVLSRAEAIAIATALTELLGGQR